MGKLDLSAPELYINRELSWLEFNDRVLRQGLAPELPLLERLKFLAIVSSNLDEFFMIRVAGLVQQRTAGLRKRDPSGMPPAKQLQAVTRRVQRMAAEHAAGIREVLGSLADHGIRLLGASQWNGEQRGFAESLFRGEILPVLTPLAFQEQRPPPLLPGLRLNVAVLVTYDAGGGGEKLAVVPVPGQLARFVTLPGEEGVQLTPLEEIIAANMGALFPGGKVLATSFFRITRDADVAVDDDEASDLLSSMQAAVLERRRRAAVRLEISARADARIRGGLVEALQLRPEEVYEIDGLLDASALMEIATRRGFERLKVSDWPPQEPRDLIGSESLWQTLQDRDVLLVHPYESFAPVVELVEQAAEDPSVLAIKQVLYRTSGRSPVVQALQRAAQRGKQVTVLVELKARFDESRNIKWARRLEDAGCHVIYGIAGFKTHAKALLIVRREAARIRRYVHLATGNYNERTAEVYSDIGLMTSDKDLAGDVAAFFNLLTGYSEATRMAQLAIAPTALRRRLTDLVEREIRSSSPEQPGLIMAKMNSLEDPRACQALYRASQAGVRVRLNVRGICCLRPGVPGISETIEVTSIVDRYLEHARILYFRNGGHEEVYLSSADWMTRNLDKRLELLFPVRDPAVRRRLTGILETYLADNIKAYRLHADGDYERVAALGEPVRAQERLYRDAVLAARSSGRPAVQFRPLTAPRDA